ncbi:hypothetical protein HJFPF1_05146 [Paramyrothecium foliicola]|nr:hypothetical protein HJFPF1_05146 [Paramyrothecium foliicola]
MASQSGLSNVGDRRAYEAEDQQNYNTADVNEAGRVHGVNITGYQDKNGIMDKLQSQDNNAQVKDRLKHEPGYAATMHGNKPSRGAEIDAELARDDEEMLAKKANKTDSMPGKKLETGTAKSDYKQEIDAENQAARAAHSNSGSNTGENQGMGYESRKNHSSRNQ